MKTHLFFFFSLFLFYACTDKGEDLIVPTLEVKQTISDFTLKESSHEIEVSTNITNWSAHVASDGQPWCSVSQESRGSKSILIIQVTENEGISVRETVVTVQANQLSETIKIRQLGYSSQILINPERVNLKSIGKNITFTITSNTEYLITSSPWIVSMEDTKTRAPEMVRSKYTFSVQANRAEEERIGELIVKEKGSEVQAKAVITQQGKNEDYATEGMDDVKGDSLIKVLRGEASSFHASEEIENSFDGDRNTIYTSNWTNNKPDYFPITLTYYLDPIDQLDYLIYTPRPSGNNGHFEKVDIYVQAQGETEFTKIMEKDFGGVSVATRVVFEEALIQPQAIRLIVKSGTGDGQGFAACAEMEFYKLGADKLIYQTLFTDYTCSQLKPGITDVAINKCNNIFYRNLALHLLDGTYPAEFRIQEYRAYPHPDIQAKENKTSGYSLLDNPTGMSVDDNEDLVIFVGDTHGNPIGLNIQNLDVPNGSGFGGTNYPLVEGMNKIKAAHRGLLYVTYYSPQFKTQKPIKIHIASGAVNGYFDSQKHAASEWNVRLNAAGNKYFDVLGKYAHLTYPVDRFKANTPDGKALIDVYDELVLLEQQLMGLEKYHKLFQNRMYFHVVYHNFMYATWYHTAYNDYTLNDLCNVQKMRGESCWGPAHEVGHCNQTAPGLKWIGMTEVTNNIKSLYVQTSFGNVSRLQGESMLDYGGYNNRYENAMTVMFRDQLAHGKMADPFCKVVPFWQLYLYVTNVLGQKDFYPDLYERVRKEADKETDGECQLQFVIDCCELSKLDLTEFFTAWGFLTEIDEMIEDYATRRLKVTGEQINQVKARIRSMGFSKPTNCFQYLCDRTVPYFQSGAAVIAGSSRRAGQTITMKNWQNVVAYEVYSDGKLIFVSPESSFTVDVALGEQINVYALSAKGIKTEVAL